MAFVMRRLLVDAQTKLRKMVEEHAANLISKTNPEYNGSLPSTLPPPSPSKFHELKLAAINQDDEVSNNRKSEESAKNIIANQTASEFKYSSTNPASETTNCSSKPNIESRRSKSLGNTSSVDESLDDHRKNIKKTNSNPVDYDELSLNFENMLEVDTNGVNGTNSKNYCVTTPEGATKRCDSPKPSCSQNPLEADTSSSRSGLSSISQRDDKVLQSPPNNCPKNSSIRRLRFENERLQAEIARLRRLVISGASSVLAEKKASTDNNGDPNNKICVLEMELQLAKEAVTMLKTDRRRLKSEKFDLLGQMKQLYASLEDKEKELRDFIRNFEDRARDSETSMQQLSTEREERERERWSLLRHARDEAERSLSLAAQLNTKELQLQQAQEQLQDARRQLASNGCLSDQESIASLPRHNLNGGAHTPGSCLGIGLLSGDLGSCSVDSGVRVNSDRESATTSVGGNLSDSTADGTTGLIMESGLDSDISALPPPHLFQTVSTKDCSPTLSPLNASYARSIDNSVLSRSVEQITSPLEVEAVQGLAKRFKHIHGRPNRGGTWGSISRVFARSRHRNKSNSLQECNDAMDSYRSWSPLTEEGYAEKLRLLRESSTIPMDRWRAPTVLAWLEIALGMGQYGARCAENIKSGKIGALHGQVLLQLSDLELECGLGITHPMHRKKLRLAIEEHRQPALVRYPIIAQLGHTWVSSEWLPDLGLSQYSDSFAGNMVDARMLEHLSKKELEKYLGVTRKFHQASIVHGIHLLRIMKYDRQTLVIRRHQCESSDVDPLVWTNQRFIRWARSIDLTEYADNLKDSGVHGGLVVLEPSFNGDTMATALGVPANKNIIRRHLTAELEALIMPARSTLQHYVRLKPKSRVQGGSLGRSFSRSCTGLTTASTSSKESFNAEQFRNNIKGSFSRALGLSKNSKSDKEKESPTSSSGSSSVIHRASPPLRYYKAGPTAESPIYAVPYNAYQPAIHTSVNRRSGEYSINANRRSLNGYEVSSSERAQDWSGNHDTKYETQSRYSNSKSDLESCENIYRRVHSIGEINGIQIDSS